MIYRNRARRAATAILCGWVTLRLILLWPGYNRPHPAPLPVANLSRPEAERDRKTRHPPGQNLPTRRQFVRHRDRAVQHQMPRLSPRRASAPTVIAIAIANVPSYHRATPLFGTAADGEGKSTFADAPAPEARDPESAAALLRPAVPSRKPASPHTRASRLSLSAWSIVRPSGHASTLATSGVLGASQAGVRARFDLIEPGKVAVVAANLRLSTPLQSPSGREAGLGISLRPARAIPVELIAEARIALDAGGRDRPAMLVAGGVSDQRLPLGLRLNAYGQAGFVGLRRPDIFIDGAATVERSLGVARAAGQRAVSLGIALAGGAQPGAARFDAGPELSLNQQLARGGLRLSGGFRWRVAGKARPGSGPAIAIGVNF